ncbi:EAL domain-containing protein (putative c-di-GMP-specific phosphodiesterase class I) [Arthrobacter sp. B3I9]|uniref:EAL domain-containing protein n=1 Tax=Arthrobacter sp. B3I9 TaxID=3042270 RepID=UPI0027933FBB|nr:EAL domain-containing protein [Arthrobacter sp. B3I9]MDQ0850681.1 EAL domain-containing protein (putative c-di-GMP-specific phosphodiesterase class I) [Arthrobacter sp. B3I9]
MSTEPTSFPHSRAAGPECPPETMPGGGAVPVIRRQAAEIIEAVLSSSEPEQGVARDQLRQRLAAHPERPEAALAEHLITLRSLAEDLLPRDAASPTQPSTSSPSRELVANTRSRIESALQGRTLLTAFQPIRELASGRVVGAEALTRFLGDAGDQPADWFAQARDALLESDLEFAALESALSAARVLPAHLYVALKLSPATCLDPLLPGLLEESDLLPERLVLEITEAMTREQPVALRAALAPLRKRGVRLAIDHAGSYFTSIRHIRQLRPDIIKLDRDLIAGIDTDPLRSSLGEAMIGFAEHIGAVVIAQGIETPAELAAVGGLGATGGQGYLLGAPTTRPEDWNVWATARQETGSLTTPDRS